MIIERVEPVIEANLTDKVGPKTRKYRLAQQKEKIERIVHYLRHGQHQDGLTKNQPTEWFVAKQKNTVLMKQVMYFIAIVLRLFFSQPLIHST